MKSFAIVKIESDLAFPKIINLIPWAKFDFKEFHYAKHYDLCKYSKL